MDIKVEAIYCKSRAEYHDKNLLHKSPGQVPASKVKYKRMIQFSMINDNSHTNVQHIDRNSGGNPFVISTLRRSR